MGDAPSTLHRELSVAVRNGRSTPPRTFRRWIEDELVIPDGPFAGERFRIERQPAIGLWIDEVDSDRWTDMVFQAVTQFGKTLFGFVAPVLYHTCELGEKFVLGVPFGDMAANKWEADIRPVLEASPSLRNLLPRHGSGSAGGKIRDAITLANGAMIKVMSAGADDSGKAGFTARCLSITEAAKFSANGEASVEADPLRQLRGRQRSFPRNERRTYIEGTVTVEEELPWMLRKDSTRSKIVSPCPRCGVYIAPTRGDLVGWQGARSEIAAAEQAYWRCPKCKGRIEEAERRDSIAAAKLLHFGQKIDRAGRITGREPESTRLYFHATPWCNLLLGAGDIGAEEWLAGRISEDSPERHNADKELSQFVHSVPYQPPKVEGQLELDKKTIAERRIELARGMLPADVQLLTVAFDIGESRSWYLVLCSRADGSLHIPDYGDIDVHSDKATPAVAIYAALMDQLPMLRAGWQIQGGQALRPHQVWADAGHESEAVWRFTREANERQTLDQWVIAARGRGSTQMGSQKYACPKKTGNQVRQIDPDGLWYAEWVRRGTCFEIHWDSDRMKWRAQHGMTLQIGKPGAISLFSGPAKIHSTLARHITNERLLIQFEPGKGETRKWHRFGHNHLLDCLAEAYCAQCRLGYQPPNMPDPDAPSDSPEAKADKPEAKAKDAKPLTPAQKKQADWFASMR